MEYVLSNYMSYMNSTFGSGIRLVLTLRSGVEYVLSNYMCYMNSTFGSGIRLV